MRSMLFVPGDSERKFGKSLGSGADAIILDLEDSVHFDNKAQARKLTADFLRHAQTLANSPAGGAKDCHPSLWVRINGLNTGFWRDDLAEIISAMPDGIMVPKPRSGADVSTLSQELDLLEAASGISAGHTKLLPIVTETALSVIHMHTYIGCSPRIAAMSWGAEDLSADIGASSNRDDAGELTSVYRLARDLCLLTSVAAGVQPVDSVFTNFRDEEGLLRECHRAARDGYSGKMAIHPVQVAPINEAFTPSQNDLARAERIVAAFDAAPSAGVAALDGEMLDLPHLIRAEKLLARARRAR